MPYCFRKKCGTLLNSKKLNHTHIIPLFGALSSALTSLAIDDAQNKWFAPSKSPNMMKKFSIIQNGILPVKTGDVHAFHHVTIWVLESAVCHLQIVCKGSLSHNQLAFTAFFLFFHLEHATGEEVSKTERISGRGQGRRGRAKRGTDGGAL